MAWQVSTSYRNAAAELFESHVGTSPTITWFDGTMPALLATADAGTVIATTTLPSNWLAAASSGSCALATTPVSVVSTATGTIRYARLMSSGGTVHGQGLVTAVGNGGDLTLSPTNVISEIGQQVSLVTFNHGIGGAG